jgi:hypothetical protein
MAVGRAVLPFPSLFVLDHVLAVLHRDGEFLEAAAGAPLRDVLWLRFHYLKMSVNLLLLENTVPGAFSVVSNVHEIECMLMLSVK